MNRIRWTQVFVFGVIALLVFLIGLSLLPMFFSGYWGMGRGGMMGGWCPWCGGTGRVGGGGLLGGLFGLLFMLPAMLIPLGLLGLLILGAVWLVRNMGGTGVPPTPGRQCPACERPVEPYWQHCPYCGEEL
ncbi:MAG: zinc ribbon domain-containing protein [Anaerolineae bacterium]|nr:zinc ribbon domain-containing protein [Anaerolineae bacterium]